MTFCYGKVQWKQIKRNTMDNIITHYKQHNLLLFCFCAFSDFNPSQI